MNSMMKVILERRSVRAYDEEKSVSEKDLVEILKAGAYAPSAMNAQAWHFTCVTNKELLLKLNAALKDTMSQAAEERIRSRSTDNTYNFYYKAPALVIVSFSDKAVYPREDAGCCMQNMMLAACSLGLGSCWINQLGNGASENVNVRNVLDEMNVPKDNKVYAALSLGYSVKSAPMKDRTPGAVNFCK